MVKKEKKKKKDLEKLKSEKEVISYEKNLQKISKSSIDTLKIKSEREIAMDFAVKVYRKFSEMIKSIILFGSSAKQVSTPDSDIDIIIIIDNASINWDEELISWYREELGKIVQQNPYKKSLHINTVKLSTWWQDLMRADPVVVNVLRYGDPLIDFGGFFIPLKVLLEQGKIKPTPESIYTLLERTPQHIMRARAGIINSLDGLYWACVDSAHAALIAAKVMPASPEHIADVLIEVFVNKGLLKKKYAEDYREIYLLAKEIVHGKKVDITGKQLDEWFEKTNDFVETMAKLVDGLIK